ncbi:hypothetical protein J1N35_014105, partial [Gossypium stocksii]
GGRWQLLQKSIGISAMHMQLLSNDRVVVFDRTDFGPSNLPLPKGKGRFDLNDTALKQDCTAHSIEYDVLSNKFRPLMVQTDVWCSSGAVTPNGDLVQTGGFNDGERKVRIFSPCSSCDWQESINGLAARRWYSTNHILPDGRQIIVGGLKQINYEFVPKNIAANTFDLPFLFETMIEKSYPSTGSAVLIPLKNLKASAIQAEVLVCGGAPKGSFSQATQEAFRPPYLEAKFNNLRPTIVGPNSMSGISYGKTLTLEMEIRGKVEEKLVWITMVEPAFNTHSFSMNQRLLVLGNDKITALGKSRYNIEVRTPRSGNLAPAGFYLLFVVHQDIPSMGIWVKLQ